ncbi:MAG: manganese efflux pump MntP family protein [Coriobacteriales bacterium]|jgi:putative Mn2+ efflux pump MntP|nr:manganese efflux pump MntP family protein [Coriobacteriales bacterium]
MGIFEIVIIAVGLAMDAFAVSITLGLSCHRLGPKEVILPGLCFGFFQALMPAIGYFVGVYLATWIEGIDHWVILALLTLIGAKMIKDSRAKQPHEAPETMDRPLRPARMLLLSLATSIDALAVGITFALLTVDIYLAITIIGVLTCLIAMAGVIIGSIFSTRFRSKAELAGGIILILVGARIALEHVLFS